MLRWVEALRGEKKESTRRQLLRYAKNMTWLIVTQKVYSTSVPLPSQLIAEAEQRQQQQQQQRPRKGSFVLQKKEIEEAARVSFNTQGRNTNTFLKNLCSLHQGSDILRTFLLVVQEGERFPALTQTYLQKACIRWRRVSTVQIDAGRI